MSFNGYHVSETTPLLDSRNDIERGARHATGNPSEHTQADGDNLQYFAVILRWLLQPSFVCLVALLYEWLLQHVNNIKHPLISTYYAGRLEDNSQWTPGNAFSAIMILQLNCVFQGAGSAIFEALLNTWRFSPLFCLFDLLKTLNDALYLITANGATLPCACHMIAAARYRSFRPTASLSFQYESIIQDLHDVRNIVRRRRILASIVALVAIFQFVKVATVRGPAHDIVLGIMFSGIFFASWLLQEAIAAVIRFSPESVLKVHRDALFIMATSIRKPWGSDQSVPQRPLLVMHHIAIVTAAMISWHLANEPVASRIPPWADKICILLLLGVPALVCWLLHRCWAAIWGAAEADVVIVNVWHAFQALAVCLLILAFYLCIYNSSNTYRPGWTDWLGKKR